jgi:hypothetical protein
MTMLQHQYGHFHATGSVDEPGKTSIMIRGEPDRRCCSPVRDRSCLFTAACRMDLDIFHSPIQRRDRPCKYWCEFRTVTGSQAVILWSLTSAVSDFRLQQVIPTATWLSGATYRQPLGYQARHTDSHLVIRRTDIYIWVGSTAVLPSTATCTNM